VWIRHLMALTLLPDNFVHYAWQMLQMPPAVSDPLLYQKLIAFSAYFNRTWISGSFPPSLWTHYDHDGPRTTNHAEGWHNSLNHTFGMPHPSLTSFLNWLQTHQFSVQCRGLQLASGRRPKLRAPKYVKLDSDIMTPKLTSICSSVIYSRTFFLNRQLGNSCTTNCHVIFDVFPTYLAFKL